MNTRRISIADICVGEPLAWNVYDSARNLLLRKGFVVRNEVQIEALVARGLFIVETHTAGDSSPTTEPPSALRVINAANDRLQRLLHNVHREVDFETKILGVVSDITRAVEINDNVALATIMLNRSAKTYSIRHCVDCAIVSLMVAQELRIVRTDIDTIMAAAVTMNIGMLRQQDLLQDKSGPLSEVEQDVVKNHPLLGMRILKQAGIKNEDWLLHVLMHHEKEDGSGYPGGRSGTRIPIGTKIISIADRYCAKISPRKYRKPLLPNAALRNLLMEEHPNIDRMVAGTFIKTLGAYPVGTFVKLENGETGIVTKKGKTTTTPIVHALIGPRQAPFAFPIRRDTSQPLYAIRSLTPDSEIPPHIDMQQLWGEEARL